MSKDKTLGGNQKELINMAAEQFARLFWKQWLNKKESEKPKPRVLRASKNGK